MKHLSQRALVAGAIELKGDEDDPIAVVSKSIEDLTKTVDDRLKAVESKGTDPKLIERLDKIEAKVNRPGTDKKPEDADEQAAAERKSFATYLRRGDKGMPEEELKALTVSNDEQGGYLAPAEMSTEFVRDLVEF